MDFNEISVARSGKIDAGVPEKTRRLRSPQVRDVRDDAVGWGGEDDGRESGTEHVAELVAPLLQALDLVVDVRDVVLDAIDPGVQVLLETVEVR